MTYTYIDEITDKVKDKCNIRDSRLASLYALLVLRKGTDLTLGDVHDAWAVWMNFKPQTERCYGHEHKSIVPFDELPHDVQVKDTRFLERLITVAYEWQNEHKNG